MKLILMKRKYRLDEYGELYHNPTYPPELFYKEQYLTCNILPYRIILKYRPMLIDKELIKEYDFNFNFTFDELKDLDFEERYKYQFNFSTKAIDGNGNICLYTDENIDGKKMSKEEKQRLEYIVKTQNDMWLKQFTPKEEQQTEPKKETLIDKVKRCISK